jgi:hypothetical protein
VHVVAGNKNVNCVPSETDVSDERILSAQRFPVRIDEQLNSIPRCRIRVSTL